MDIQLIAIDPEDKTVRWGSQPKNITGLSKLVQVVVLSLLNVPGNDVLDPDLGGGLPAMIGSNIDLENQSEVFAEVARRVSKTQREVIAAQVGLDLPSDERLRDIQIVSLTPGASADELLVKLRVVNANGNITDLVL
jgi:hypothetical protein